jgi:hypothetical protein
MFHVRIEVEGEKKAEYVWDLAAATVEQRFAAPWRTGEVLLVNGRRIPAAEVRRFQIFSSDGGRNELERAWNQRADEAARNGMFTLQNNGELWLKFADDSTDRFLLRSEGDGEEGVTSGAPASTEHPAGEVAVPTIRAFVSYKWESPEHVRWVEGLARDLRQQGVETILDQWEVRLGESITDYMQKHINSADVILFVITPAAVVAAEASAGEGGALKFEVQMANSRRIQEGTRIVGVYRSGDRPPHYLRDNRYADFRDDTKYADSISALADDLLGRGGPPPVATSSRDKQSNSTATSRRQEMHSKPGLELVLAALEGSDKDLKVAIARSLLFVKLTAGGDPRSLSSGERVLSLFNNISTVEKRIAIDQCRAMSMSLFGEAPAQDLRGLMRFLVTRAIQQSEEANPFS